MSMSVCSATATELAPPLLAMGTRAWRAASMSRRSYPALMSCTSLRRGAARQRSRPRARATGALEPPPWTGAPGALRRASRMGTRRRTHPSRASSTSMPRWRQKELAWARSRAARAGAGRVFTMFVAVVGVGSLFYALGVLMEYLVTVRLADPGGRRRMQKQIDKLKGHVILAGLGRVGGRAALGGQEGG